MNPTDPAEDEPEPAGGEVVRKRRERYRGTHPRKFREKYKELDPAKDPETVARVIASGKTPAGQHRPILVEEILGALKPELGDRGADVTLGYGGHSEAILGKMKPGGMLLGLDVDPVQLPRTEERLRALGFGEERLVVRRSNYAGLVGMLGKVGWEDGLDFALADLGLSSMQIDNPERGFSYKHEGPLDMRMNPERGVSARDWLAGCRGDKLAGALREGGDERRAESIAEAICGAVLKGAMETTRQLRRVVEHSLPPRTEDDERAATVARVFQAIRIAVNEELGALDVFLKCLPGCLRPGGRVAILSFHSGEDRRVKQHFREGLRAGGYSEVSREVIRPGREEVRSNPRASPAKLRWAVKS